MREIWFRGKRKDDGVWVQGDFVSSGFGIAYEDYLNEYGDVGYVYRDVIPETIGQYTGLTDKNGKKIFEGDIVTAHFKSNRHRTTFKVDVMDGMFIFDNGLARVNFWDIYCLKVIGNIHDNPELLKSGVQGE